MEKISKLLKNAESDIVTAISANDGSYCFHSQEEQAKFLFQHINYAVQYLNESLKILSVTEGIQIPEVKKEFKKSLIISGMHGTGKTTLIKAFAQMYDQEEVFFWDVRTNASTSNNLKKTSLVIIDEVQSAKHVVVIHKDLSKLFPNAKFIFATQDNCILLSGSDQYDVVTLH